MSLRLITLLSLIAVFVPPVAAQAPSGSGAAEAPPRVVTDETPVAHQAGETPAPHQGGPALAPRPLEMCVPADAMAVYFGRPAATTSAPASVPTTQGAVSQLSGWVVTLKAMGIIPRQGRWFADVVGTMPILTSRPHAAVLLDVTPKRLPGESYRLATLQAGFIIESTGIGQEIDRRVRDLLATYTDAENGKIETVREGAVTRHRYTDRRLDPWAVAEWAYVGPWFVAGFGEGALTRMLDALGARPAVTATQPVTVLGADPWFARGHVRCHGADSGIEVYLHITRIRARVGQVVQRRHEEVLKALNLASADRLLWALGYDGRALRSEFIARTTEGTDQYGMLTGREVTDPAVTAAIPPAASRYAVFRFPLGPAVLNARDAYLQSRSPARREIVLARWAELEKKLGFNVRADLLDRLGENFVMHNYPPHPLSSALMLTLWAQYHGERAPVAASVDGVMRVWQAFIARPTTRPIFRLSPQVNRTEDGIWYLQLGLVGPAIAVADGWIVISYSPEAVRVNLAYLRR